jgi:hypothetical protein
LDQFSGNLEEMDAAVQGEMEGDNWKLLRGVGEEGTVATLDRMVLEKRRIAMKMVGPGTPEVRGEARMNIYMTKMEGKKKFDKKVKRCPLLDVELGCPLCVEVVCLRCKRVLSKRWSVRVKTTKQT